MSLAVVPGDWIDGRPRDPSRLDGTLDAVRVTTDSRTLVLFRDTRLHTVLHCSYHHVQGTAERGGSPPSPGDL